MGTTHAQMTIYGYIVSRDPILLTLSCGSDALALSEEARSMRRSGLELGLGLGLRSGLELGLGQALSSDQGQG